MKKYIFLVLFLLCGCSPVDIEPARQEVNIFRGLYQTGKYSDIYKITSSDFQTATSEKKFIDIMNEAKEKILGLIKNQPLKLKKKITRGLFSNDEITLIYFSEYSKKNCPRGFFVFNVEDKKKVKLKGYRYDSIN
ncbi:type IV secretion protein Rhs [Escherichia coli]|nr:type IV secretion protein Rhs [Escherichia coli]QJT86010.1 type IV secretion protein Rhs [Escherichia coli]